MDEEAPDLTLEQRVRLLELRVDNHDFALSGYFSWLGHFATRLRIVFVKVLQLWTWASPGRIRSVSNSSVSGL